MSIAYFNNWCLYKIIKIKQQPCTSLVISVPYAELHIQVPNANGICSILYCKVVLCYNL